MFSPRLRPLKGHDRSYGSCKMNCIYICTELNLQMLIFRFKRNTERYDVAYIVDGLMTLFRTFWCKWVNIDKDVYLFIYIRM